MGSIPETGLFFDATCRVGRRAIVHPGSFYETDMLLERMKACGIGEALVYHNMAREYSPEVGNELLAQETAGRAELHGVWVALPHHTAEFPEPEALVSRMKRAGIKAVRMFPAAAEHNFSLEAWSCGELFEALEHYLVPLFLGMDQLGWNDLFELCRSYPALPIVLTEVNYRMDRRLYPLLERFPQLRIETIGYKVHLGIEELCKRFGAERLVFGSGMPLYSGAAAVSMVRYAGIGEREKRLIAGDNLRAMLKEVRL